MAKCEISDERNFKEQLEMSDYEQAGLNFRRRSASSACEL